jgi:hypothetical protein
MSETTYPFTAWTLTPSFAPKEVTLVKRGYYESYHVTTGGKHYLNSDLQANKAECIKAGWRRIDEQQAVLDKRAAAIEKKKLNLTKHSLNPA